MNQKKTMLQISEYDTQNLPSSKTCTKNEALEQLALEFKRFEGDCMVVDYDVKEGQEPVRTPMEEVFATIDFSQASHFEVELVHGSTADGGRFFLAWGDETKFDHFYNDDTLRVVVDGVEQIFELEREEWD